MPTLKDIIEQSDTRSGRWFDLTIQALIFVSLITFSLETLEMVTFSGTGHSLILGD
jgi:voltage-gated potassium channel